MSGKPKGFGCTVRWKDLPDGAASDVFIAQSLDCPAEDDDNGNVFYWAGDYPESVIRKRYSLAESSEDWYIVEETNAA
jgi:hypothetical protein